MKLEIHQLTKQYGPHKALDSLDLLLPAFQSLVLVGPSGSGKSTLLRLLAGLAIPDEGWIAFDGHRLERSEPALRRYRSHLGIVFQSWNLFPHLSALENIILPLHRVHKHSYEESRTRGIALLERFDLLRHAHKRPFELSGGQQQRVALIRAVAGQPQVLLLDEPTSALDPLMAAEVMELIQELKNELKGLILVTHHVQFAKRIGDHLLFIADGQILEQGPIPEIFEQVKSPLAKQYMSKVLEY